MFSRVRRLVQVDMEMWCSVPLPGKDLTTPVAVDVSVEQLPAFSPCREHLSYKEPPNKVMSF